MTTSPKNAVLRTIFVHPRLARAGEAATPLPTHRLLRDLGHDVTSFESIADATDRMECEPIDLLIVDEPDRADGGFVHDTVSRIRNLPSDQQPRDLAIFSTRPDIAAEARPLVGPRVHVLLKPLHVHGLLQVLRQIESND